MPSDAPVNSRSSQCGAIRLFSVACGRHALVNVVAELVNCRFPFDIALTLLNVVP